MASACSIFLMISTEMNAGTAAGTFAVVAALAQVLWRSRNEFGGTTSRWMDIAASGQRTRQRVAGPAPDTNSVSTVAVRGHTSGGRNAADLCSVPEQQRAPGATGPEAKAKIAAGFAGAFVTCSVLLLHLAAPGFDDPQTVPLLGCALGLVGACIGYANRNDETISAGAILVAASLITGTGTYCLIAL